MQENRTALATARDGGRTGRAGAPRGVLTRRRLVRLGWITAVLVAVGGQLWLFLKLFFASLTPEEGEGSALVVRSRSSP